MSLSFAPADVAAVAQALLGEPNKRLSTKGEMRFGTHGSMCVDLAKGTFFDNEIKEGGGMLDLVARAKGLKGREAVDFLRGHNIQVSDDRPPFDGGRPSNRPSQRDEKPKPKVVATYDYRDEAGEVVLQVLRYEPKTFRQRRPFKDGWAWGLKAGPYRQGERGRDWFMVKGDGLAGDVELPDVRHIPYRLADLREAISDGATIFIVEGEKDVENLAKIGVPATCNAAGAGKWPTELNRWFRDADVVILRDNDEAGRKHGNLVVSNMFAAEARAIRYLDLPGLGPKQDVSDWLDAGGNADQLYDLVHSSAYSADVDERAIIDAPSPENQPFQSRFHAIPWAELDLPGPEHEWLVKNIITRGERSMMVGASQSGKSFLALDLAMTIARGQPWFGNRAVRGGVVYQAGEGGRGIKKRLRAYRAENGLDLADRLPFVLLPSPVDLYASDDQTNALIAEINHWRLTFECPLELVVIDTLSAATPGADENSSKDIGPVLARCDRIAQQCGCAVMLVHHMNAGGQKPRGHTSILANLDSVLTVAKVEGAMDIDRRQIREIETAKQKDGEAGKRWRFVLPAVEIGRDADGDPVTSCVVRPPNIDGEPGETGGKADAGLKLSPQGEIFLRAVYEAVDQHGESAPAILRVPQGTTVVRWKFVAEAFGRMAFEGADEGDPQKRQNAISQAMKRHGEKLMQLRVIMRESPFIWLTGRKVSGFSHRVVAPPTEAERTAGSLLDGHNEAFT